MSKRGQAEGGDETEAAGDVGLSLADAGNDADQTLFRIPAGVAPPVARSTIVGGSGTPTLNDSSEREPPLPAVVMLPGESKTEEGCLEEKISDLDDDDSGFGSEEADTKAQEIASAVSRRILGPQTYPVVPGGVNSEQQDEAARQEGKTSLGQDEIEDVLQRNSSAQPATRDSDERAVSAETQVPLPHTSSSGLWAGLDRFGPSLSEALGMAGGHSVEDTPHANGMVAAFRPALASADEAHEGSIRQQSRGSFGRTRDLGGVEWGQRDWREPWRANSYWMRPEVGGQWGEPSPTATATDSWGEGGMSWRTHMNHPLAWEGVRLEHDDGRLGEIFDTAASFDRGRLPSADGAIGTAIVANTPGRGKSFFRPILARKEHSPTVSSAMEARQHPLESKVDTEELPGEPCFESFGVSEDVTVAILSYLDARDLARAAAACHGWRRCTNTRQLWSAVYARDFHGHMTIGRSLTVPGTSSDMSALDPGAAVAHSGTDSSGNNTFSYPGIDLGMGHWPYRGSLEGRYGFVRPRGPPGGHHVDDYRAGRLFSSAPGRRYGVAGGGGFGAAHGVGGGVLYDNPKERYAKRLNERRERLEKQQKNELLRAAQKRADRRRRGYEKALDCLHVRLLPPLTGLSLALTLVFMAAWLDGDLANWDYWRVMAPMWILCGVGALAVTTGVHAWRHQGVARSSFRSTFAGLRGAIRYFMSEVVLNQTSGVVSGLVLTFLLALQLIMLGLQIQGDMEANWFAVFLPLFLCFMVLCLAPCLQWTSCGDGGAYLLGMMLGWFPTVLCTLLVCFRLEGEAISMSVIMAPLWAVDLVLILAPVAVAAVVATRRLRHGEPIEAMMVHTLAASWCLLTPVLAPIVAFEIALTVYAEQGDGGSLTAAEVFTPLIVWCCLLSLILCGYACSYPPRHTEPMESTLGTEPSFALAPSAFPSRAPRAFAGTSLSRATAAPVTTALTGSGDGGGDVGLGPDAGFAPPWDVRGFMQNASIYRNHPRNHPVSNNTGAMSGAGDTNGEVDIEGRQATLRIQTERNSPVPGVAPAFTSADDASTVSAVNGASARRLSPNNDGTTAPGTDVAALRVHLAHFGILAGVLDQNADSSIPHALEASLFESGTARGSETAHESVVTAGDNHQEGFSRGDGSAQGMEADASLGSEADAGDDEWAV